MAVLVAFCDESEVAEGGVRALTIAGAVADGESWIEFRKPWKEALDLNQVPYFHASELESSRGPYEGWERWRRIAFQDHLIGVIEGTIPIVFAASLVLNDYEKLTSEERRTLGTPYEICAQFCVRNLSILLNQDPWRLSDDQVHYVFEQLHHDKERLSDSFRRALEIRPERRLAGPPHWARKQDYVELQVADMLAYEVGKETLRRLGAHQREQRKSLAALMGRVPLGKVYYMNERILRGFLDRGWTDLASPQTSAVS